MSSDKQTEQATFYFDNKGHGGPEFSTEAEVQDYINNDLLADAESRDPDKFQVQMILNGITLSKHVTDSEGNTIIYQWSERSITRFPEDGFIRNCFK